MAVNPKSLKNLTGTGRKPFYEQKKKKRAVDVTDRGWAGLKTLAKEEFGTSLAELLEKIGRGDLLVMQLDDPNSDR